MGMEVLYILIPASFLLALISLCLFLWGNHSGQFDDLVTPAIRILMDDPSETVLKSGENPTNSFDSPGDGNAHYSR